MTQRARPLQVAVAFVLLLVATAVVVVVRRDSDEPCGAARRLAAHSPLLDVDGMAGQPDERLDALATSVNAMRAPFGPVRAGVGFDYDQWLHLYGVPGGVLAWTKNNAPVTFLDGTDLAPRWSLRPATKRTAWDVVGRKFLLLDLSATRPTKVAAYDLGTGREAWCTTVTSKQRDGDPVGTTSVVGGDVVTAFRSGSRIRLTRLDADDGTRHWQRDVAGADRADFLGPVPGHLFVVGGTEEYRLAQADPKAPGGPVVSAYTTGHGATRWSWSVPAGTVAHVVGLDYDRPVVMVRTATGTELVGLSSTGTEQWRTPLRAGSYQATLRGSVVLTRSAGGLNAYDSSTGKRLWRRAVPTDRTYFPYGFTLDQMPSLDQTHLLVPTTTDLQVLDLLTGRSRTYPLPVDGLSTTYWPYQLLVTEHLLGVVTNTGGIVADRE
ncbi:MAG: PQQ-binding-like beta-propeller repeat protein [Marmoricola sp.]